jgi:16S rRNA (guanine527-N7)-methyltransferase
MSAGFPRAAARARLDAGLERLGLAFDPEVLESLIEFLVLLDEANQVHNLTAIREPLAMVDKHLLDALAIWPHARGRRLLDIGSGGGVPGIPLLLAGACPSGLLVESIGKKARFLSNAVHALGLATVEVAAARAERLPREGGGDVVVSRALGRLAEFVRLAGHLVQPGGRLLAMKGKAPDDELGELRAPWRVGRVIPYAVPFVEGERHLVVLQRA